MSGQRPRRAVLADSWVAAEIDAPALCNREGVPVVRALKCLLDPLVIRPRLRPHLAAPLLDAPAAAELTDLLREHRDRLEDTGAWFLRLRAARRRARITHGNAQELYFPRAYELACGHGAPGADADSLADDVIAEIHGDEVRTGDLRELLDALAPDVLSREWEVDAPAPDIARLASDLWELLDSGPWESLESPDVGPWALGMRASPGQLEALWGQLSWEGPVEGVLLSEHDPLPAPPLRDRGGDSRQVLDRSLDARARAALRRARDLIESAEEILDAEIDRARAPFGLSGPSWQVAFAAGVMLSAGLDPLAGRRDFGPRLLREVQSRVAKEAYVMHLRRQLVAGQSIDPRQEKVVDQLHDFWLPYLNRLWARLHGLDVLGRSPRDTDEVWSILSGVARSVMYDHRQLIRNALESHAA